jgi:hypothetical protein
MKLVLLMFLEEDAECVNRLLGELQVEAFSRLAVEGHGPGSSAGWSGQIQPYKSQIVMSILPDDQASSLMQAVDTCTGVEDPRHPIRAALMSVEKFSCCSLGQP